MGIGYIGLESYADPSGATYANLPVCLFDQGVSETIGYSLWFKSNDSSSTARLIFGGIDTNQFYGELQTIPISMDQLQNHYVTVKLDGLTITNGSGNSTNVTSQPTPVILHSCTSRMLTLFSITLTTRFHWHRS